MVHAIDDGCGGSQVETNEKIIREFFDSWADGSMADALDKHFADDVRWLNSGFPAAEGKDACRKLAASFSGPFPTIVVEILAIAASGEDVLVERIDHCRPADGSATVDVEVNGSFKLRDGQVVYWYDYFDPRPFLTGAAG
jgi:limonene-1,2-epoxide hydrolase